MAGPVRDHAVLMIQGGDAGDPTYSLEKWTLLVSMACRLLTQPHLDETLSRVEWIEPPQAGAARHASYFTRMPIP